MLSFMVRIGMSADVKPGPSIKAAGAHTADIVRRQILPNLVPLVCAHPELIAAGPKCDPNGVANSPSIDFSVGAVGIEFEDASAICFRGVIRNIRARPNGDVHFLAVG